jgi:hypothetical protein
VRTRRPSADGAYGAAGHDGLSWNGGATGRRRWLRL